MRPILQRKIKQFYSFQREHWISVVIRLVDGSPFTIYWCTYIEVFLEQSILQK